MTDDATTTNRHDHVPSIIRDKVVILSRSRQPASTVLDIESRMERIWLEGSSYTYRVALAEPSRKPLRSFTITAPVIFRGKVKRPPLDDQFVLY